MATLQALAVGSLELLTRPCVDCGLKTCRFSDPCFAQERMPEEGWAENQHTPLCSMCDNAHDMCHYCRGVPWCAPPPHD